MTPPDGVSSDVVGRDPRLRCGRGGHRRIRHNHRGSSPPFWAKPRLRLGLQGPKELAVLAEGYVDKNQQFHGSEGAWKARVFLLNVWQEKRYWAKRGTCRVLARGRFASSRGGGVLPEQWIPIVRWSAELGIDLAVASIDNERQPTGPSRSEYLRRPFGGSDDGPLPPDGTPLTFLGFLDTDLFPTPQGDIVRVGHAGSSLIVVRDKVRIDVTFRCEVDYDDGALAVKDWTVPIDFTGSHPVYGPASEVST